MGISYPFYRYGNRDLEKLNSWLKVPQQGRKKWDGFEAGSTQSKAPACCRDREVPPCAAGGQRRPRTGPFPGSLGDPRSHEALTCPSRPQLKEHPERGVYVKGLSMHTVHSVAQCERIMETGWKNRSVGYTLMNKDSSRSHSIFTISIEIYAVGTCWGCWGRGSRSRAPRPFTSRGLGGPIRNWEKVLKRPGGHPGGPSCARSGPGFLEKQQQHQYCRWLLTLSTYYGPQFLRVSLFIPYHSPGGGYPCCPHFTNEETEVLQLESVRAGPRSQGSVSSVSCLDLSVSPLSLWCSPPFSHPPRPPV